MCQLHHLAGACAIAGGVNIENMHLQVQQLTDEHVANVDRLCGSKQKELQVL